MKVTNWLGVVIFVSLPLFCFAAILIEGLRGNKRDKDEEFDL